MKTGIERIAEERARQVAKEGYLAKHDEQHDDCELVRAAICYAAPERVYVRRTYTMGEHFVDPWPFSVMDDKRPCCGGNLRKPTREEYIRLLEKAGALIAAQIDLLLRGDKQCEP